MSNTNFITIVRMCERAVTIREESTDPIVLAAGPVFEESFFEYQEADKAVGLIATEAGQAWTARDEAMQVFEPVYDKTRSCILSWMPYAQVPDRASAMGTPDDTLNSSKKMKDLLFTVGGMDEAHPLDGQGESAPTGPVWAVDVARYFVPQLEAATLKFRQAFTTAERLKQAVENRAEKRAALETHFLAFRRVVRDVYGPKSHQYHSLRERGESKSDEDDQPPAPLPAPEPTAP